MEVGIKAINNTMHVIMKEHGVIDGIAQQKPLLSEATAEKRVERAEGQLETHGSFKN